MRSPPRTSHAPVSAIVDLRLGAALETLPKLYAEAAGPFDFIFIDADKINMPAYMDWAIRLSHPGTIIIGDNVVREGAILNPGDPDPRVQGTRQLFEMLASDQRVDSTAVQTVGSKGYDGFAIALVR